MSLIKKIKVFSIVVYKFTMTKSQGDTRNVYKSNRNRKFKCPTRFQRPSQRQGSVYAVEGKDRCSYFLSRGRTKGAVGFFL